MVNLLLVLTVFSLILGSTSAGLIFVSLAIIALALGSTEE